MSRSAVTAPVIETLGELVERRGHVSLERIRFWPGMRTPRKAQVTIGAYD
ncbi:MAG: hypothetical protein HYU36_18455 [Planctomycetes bacterium]|nr:hypothetical protein [Planctomycetota bacterium]